MIHFDATHRIIVICILLFGITVLYITLFTDAFINRRQIQSLPKSEMAEAVPLWVGLIIALGLSCTAFAIDVLFVHQGLFR
jgi:uncharacterized membrane protein